LAEKIVVRPLQASDAAAVRRLDRLILGRDRSGTWDAHVERFLDTADIEALPEPPFGSHVAEWQGEIVGFVLSEFQAGEYGLPRGAWIVAVAVAPEMRRTGVGKRLVEALLEQCRKQGVEDVYAVVRPGDGRVADFLAACGMEASKVTVLGRRV
jgi:N-acetylglutamate synthase-like GNAT family acetyltransferase